MTLGIVDDAYRTMCSRRRWLVRPVQTAPSVLPRTIEGTGAWRIVGGMKKGRSVRDNLVLGYRQASNHALGISGCQGCPRAWGEMLL